MTKSRPIFRHVSITFRPDEEAGLFVRRRKTNGWNHCKGCHSHHPAEMFEVVPVPDKAREELLSAIKSAQVPPANPLPPPSPVPGGSG
jgi:hypothetical protein